MTTDLNRALQQLSIATFNRRRLLASAGITIGGAALAATPLMASAQADSTPTDGDDMSMFAEPVDVLNYALTLEHLEAAFYRDGLAAIGEAGITGLGFQASVYQQLMTIGDALLTAALTIHGNEARHAAYLGLLNAVSPFPESFNPTLTPEAVLEIAGPFIVG